MRSDSSKTVGPMVSPSIGPLRGSQGQRIYILVGLGLGCTELGVPDYGSTGKKAYPSVSASPRQP
eukprot:4794649-Pyramimonas_sp.AAC.1